MPNYLTQYRRTRTPGYIAGVQPVSGFPSGSFLWLAADNLALSDGNAIASWADKSPEVNNASAAGGLQPTYKSNIINGLPVARFAGGQLMTIANIASINPTTMSAFVVASVTGQQGGENGFFFMKNASAGTGQTVYGVGRAFSVITNKWTMSLNLSGSNWADHASTADLSLSAFALLSCTFDGSNWRLYKNAATDGNGALSGSIYAASTGTLQIGGYNASWSGQERLIGDIAEIILFNSALSDVDRQAVEAMLNTKYAIY